MSNKVLVNNSTRISLNDRFTIMQNVGVAAGPSATAPTAIHPRSPNMQRPRSRSRSRSRSVGRMAHPQSMQMSPRVQPIPISPRSRLARHYEDVLDRRQKLARAAQQLRGVRAAPRGINGKQRYDSFAMNRSPGTTMAGIRGVRRTRAAPATMRMDRQLANPARGGIRNRLMMTAAATLRQRRLNRAIATVNKAQLKRQAPIGGANGRLSRMDLARSMTKAKLIRQRSNSRSNVNLNGGSNLRRSNSRNNLQAVHGSQANLRRSNSRQNLNQGQMAGQQQQQPRRKINRDFQQRSRSRSRGKTPSIASRLGVRPGNNNNNNSNSNQNKNGPRGGQTPVAGGRQRQRSNSISARLGKQGVLNKVAQGRVSKQQRLGVAQNKKNMVNGNRNQNQKQNNNVKNQLNQGRNGKQIARGRNQGVNKIIGAVKNMKKSGLQQRLQKGGQRQPQKNQQQQQQGQGKGRRGKRGNKPTGGAPKKPLKKEDLDKELDKYMSTSNN